MQWSRDVGQADWIGPRLDDFLAAQVTSTVPRGFAAYARLLHPARHLDGRRLSWAQVAARSAVTLTPQTRFWALTRPLRKHTAPASDPLADPLDGSLEPTDARTLVEILTDHTPPEMRCWFAVWDGYGWDNTTRFVLTAPPATTIPAPEKLPDPIPTEVRDGPRVVLPYRQYHLFTGQIEDALSFVPDKHQTPNLWWPQDRSWCVASEIDDFVTYIAGPTALIEQLHSDPHLETQLAHQGEPKVTVDPNLSL